MTDTVVQLGTFTFQNLEIPESINFGGQQQIVQHDLIGGNRVLDVLGKNDDDITWSGLMTGPQALTRAMQLNLMRVNGTPLSLTLFNLNYKVIIQHFKANIERFYQVRYEITLRIVTDNITPVQTVNPTGFTQAITADLAMANTLTQAINDPATTTNMAAVNTAYDNAVTSGRTGTTANVSSPLEENSVTQNNVTQSSNQSISNATPQGISNLQNSISLMTTALMATPLGPIAVLATSLFGSSS